MPKKPMQTQLLYRRYILFLVVAMLFTTVGFSADGDPDIGIPTIVQGRAILSRDLLRRQCEIAIAEERWEDLKELVRRTLAEERVAFGADFEGTSLTATYRTVAETHLQEPSTQFQPFRDDVTKHLRKIFNAPIPEGFDEETVRDFDKKVIDQNKKFDQLVTSTSKVLGFSVSSAASGDYQQLDAEVAKCCSIFHELFGADDPTPQTEFSDDPEIAALEKKLAELQRQELAEKRAAETQFAWLLMLRSQGFVRADEIPAAIVAARKAFTLVATADPKWFEDERPMIGGRSIAIHLFNLLNDETWKSQREAGKWEEAIATFNEMLPLAEFLSDDPNVYREYRDTCRMLAKMPPEKQMAFAKTFRDADLFSVAWNANDVDKALSIGLDIADTRTAILGEDCLLAAQMNDNLGLLYWKNGNYAAAFQRLLMSVKVLHRVLYSNNTEVKVALYNLSYNAKLAASLEDPPENLVRDLEAFLKSAGSYENENTASLADCEQTLILVKRLVEFNAEDRKKNAVLHELRNVRNEQFRQGKYSDAAMHASLCSSGSKSLLGKDSPTYLDDLRAEANCLLRSGKHELAIAISEDILEAFDKPPYNETAAFSDVYLGYANGLQERVSIADAKTARSWIKKSQSLTAKTSGESDQLARKLSAEAGLLRDHLFNPAEALILFQRAGSIFAGLGIGKESWDYCQNLVNVAQCHTMLGLFEASEQHLIESLRIRKKREYRNSYMLAWNYWALGQNAFHAGRFADSTNYFQRALEIKERDTPHATDIPDVYGYLLRSASWTEDGEAISEDYYEQFLERRRKYRGDDLVAFADDCRAAANFIMLEPGDLFFGQVNDLRGDLVTRLAELAQNIYETQKTPDRRLLHCIQLQGCAAAHTGKRRFAENLFTDLSAKIDSVDQDANDLRGQAHVGISNIKSDQLVFDEALRHRRLALECFRSFYGRDSAQVANVLAGIGTTLISFSDFEQAEEYIREAATIYENLGHDKTVEANRWLAVIYRKRGELERSEQYLHYAKSKLRPGLVNQDMAITCDRSLAHLMLIQGDFDQAIELTESMEANLAAHPHLVAPSGDINSIRGIALLAKGNPKEAKRILQQVVVKSDNSFQKLTTVEIKEGQDDLPQSVSSQTRSAFVRACFETGDKETALAELRDELVFAEERLRDFGGVLSKRQKLELRRRVQAAVDSFISHGIEQDLDPAVVYDAIVRMKGLVFAEEVAQREAQRSLKTTAAIALAAELKDINRQLSKTLFANTGKVDRTQSIQDLRDLSKRRDELEAQLAELSSGNGQRTERSKVNLATIQNMLSDGEVLIDFIEYQHHKEPGLPNSKVEPRLIAFVTGKDSFKQIALGSSRESLAKTVRDWREAISSRKSAEFEAANAELGKILLGELKPLIQECKTIFISPDSVLSQIAFAALPTGEDEYLIDRCNVISVTAPRMLLRKRQLLKTIAAESQSPHVLLVGAVNYSHAKVLPVDSPPGPLHFDADEDLTQHLALRSASQVSEWDFLPGTETEIKGIEQVIAKFNDKSSVTVLSGADASETAFAVQRNAKWIHLATHGFFAQTRENGDEWGFQSLSRDAVSGFDPSLLTGIVLAGANRIAEDEDEGEDRGEEDGILTAAEIELLDLRDTEMVVLSACETALGEGKTGEGVLGLQRSLHMAGCKNVVASLWKVDDQATAILMQEFYRQVCEENKTPAEAIRAAQLMLRQNKDNIAGQLRGVTRIDSPDESDVKGVPPFYWAAFTVSLN